MLLISIAEMLNVDQGPIAGFLSISVSTQAPFPFRALYLNTSFTVPTFPAHGDCLLCRIEDCEDGRRGHILRRLNWTPSCTKHDLHDSCIVVYHSVSNTLCRTRLFLIGTASRFTYPVACKKDKDCGGCALAYL